MPWVFCQQNISVSLLSHSLLAAKAVQRVFAERPSYTISFWTFKTFCHVSSFGWSFPFLLICTGRNFLSPFNRHCPFLRARTATSRCKQNIIFSKMSITDLCSLRNSNPSFLPIVLLQTLQRFFVLRKPKKKLNLVRWLAAWHILSEQPKYAHGFCSRTPSWIEIHSVPPKVKQRVYEKIVQVYYLCFYNAVIRHFCLSWIKYLWRKQKSSLKCAHF